jgi:MGT family glycosyltransferase
MPTVAVVHFPSSGHIRPILPLVTALNEAGLHTVQWAQAGWEDGCLAAGGEFRVLPEPPDISLAAPLPLLIAEFLARYAERLAPFMSEQLAETRCDVVLRDSFAQYAHFAARENGLEEYVVPAMMAFHRGCRPSLRDTPSFAAGLAKGVRQARNMYRVSRRMRQRYGQGLGSPLDVFAGRHGSPTFVMTVPALQMRPERLRGEEIHYIGALRALSATGAAGEPALDGLGEDQRVIYVSLGTVFEQRPAFFRAAAEALAGLGRRVILSIGRTPPEAVGSLPDGVVARAEVDQLAVLRRADLFITHGGFNSMQEGMAAGVPVVLCPLMFEQAMNAEVLVAQGAGVRARSEDPQDLRDAAERVLAEPSYRDAAQRLAQELRQGCNAGEAVARLAASARRHSALGA